MSIEAMFRAMGRLAAIAMLVAGCGDPAGTPCMTRGSGFHATHDCRHRCLSRWDIACPDGERITPNLCTGAFGCEPGGCPEGQVCYFDDDPFDDRSFCVVETTCGPQTQAELRQWELDRVAAQRAVQARRAEQEARKARWRAENPAVPATAAPADR